MLPAHSVLGRRSRTTRLCAAFPTADSVAKVSVAGYRDLLAEGFRVQEDQCKSLFVCGYIRSRARGSIAILNCDPHLTSNVKHSLALTPRDDDDL